ncbi:hypothetical protein BDZ89DRAFT_1053792 [Hymenopellis radicata]|nr:hypothetical protein BDZ89DRAFT_1053792 [Hymenopellis radicata]
MSPYANDHNHSDSNKTLSDVPPFSLTKLDYSRPIVVIDHRERRVILHVRDPFLTGKEIYEYCAFGDIPKRYDGTGHDIDAIAYPFNLSYLEMVESQVEIVGRDLWWAKNGFKYGNGKYFYWDRHDKLRTYGGEHVFTYRQFDSALRKMERLLDRRYFDGFVLALHEHLYNAIHTAPHVNDRWRQKQVWTFIPTEYPKG